MNPHSATRYYEQRIEEISRRITELERRAAKLTCWRGITALSAITLAVYWWLSGAEGLIGYGIAAALFAAFVTVVGIHEQLFASAAELRQRLDINQHSIDRLRRDWERLLVPNVDVPAEQLIAIWGRVVRTLRR